MQRSTFWHGKCNWVRTKLKLNDAVNDSPLAFETGHRKKSAQADGDRLEGLHIIQGGIVLKSSIFRVAIACALVGLMAPIAAAQQQGQKGIVTVLDINKVFKNHKKFEQSMNQIKSEIEAFEAQMNQKGTALRTRLQTLSEEFKPGTEEYIREETKLAREDADLQIEANQKRKEVADRQAQIFYDTYQEVVGVVEKLAGQYNIALVLRYDSTVINRDNRAEVIRGVNRNVVFQRDLDLTNLVLSQLGYPETAVNGGDTSNR